ncbi:STAS-like domain-containing protein [Anaerotignum sp.]
MNVILIKNFISGDIAISYEDGKKCLREIITKLCEIKDNEKIVLDFSGVEYVITAFLNPVIGDLIIEKGIDVMKSISIKNANEDIIKKIKLVKDGALLKREDLNA